MLLSFHKGSLSSSLKKLSRKFTLDIIGGTGTTFWLSLEEPE